MKEARNPFYVRTVENIESDDTFLNLFEPTTLDAFDSDQIWDRLHIIRSAQGGGKSSLLRMFTPHCLWRIWKDRQTSSQRQELFGALKHFNIFSQSGPRVLGVIIPCKKPYSTLEHLQGSADAKLRLFYALIDARCISEAIKGALSLRGLRYPEDVDKVSLNLGDSDEFSGHIPTSGSAQEYMKWARDTESKIWNCIDDGEDERTSSLGHVEIHSMQLLRSGAISVSGKPISGHVILMFDDTHRLSSYQRKALQEHAATSRPKVAVWMAERLQALQPSEIISLGAVTGREIVEQNLASHWQKAARDRPKVFEVIGSRRVDESTERVRESFGSIVNVPIEQADYLESMRRAFSVLKARVDLRLKGVDLFKGLDVPNADDSDQDLFDALIELKRAEIIIERNMGATQKSFDFPEGLEMPKEEEAARLRAAAHYQLAIEFQLPYYYGLDNLAKLSSSNIDQFLFIAGGVFEELLSMRVRNKRPPVAAGRQEQAVLRAAKQLWDDIPVRVPQGIRVQTFLNAVGRFCKELSLGKRASYGAGVTGFALTSEDHDFLASSKAREQDDLRILGDVIAWSVAHNLLLMERGHRQGKKGRTLTVFYLNRLLCAEMRLPLGYGGWRHKKLATLSLWAMTGVPVASEDETLDLFGPEAL